MKWVRRIYGMQQLIECVPNFSDGRRPEVYQAIAAAIRRVDGVRVLDVSPDSDHNRTVITFVGDPAGVEEAAFQAIKTAASLIDLGQHKGEHPRIGATDVCPFIPIRGVSMADCVAFAKRLGQRVGQELGIAVYLYAEAATRPERIKLADIRKGEFEQWYNEVATNPARQPDYGPAIPQPWGATVIGARPFLIAYNIYLNTGRVELADLVARAVRTISGGLSNVQGLGFLVEGQAQVSMNLTNFEKTPIHRVQEMVRREAARYGLSITKAELVGLIPQAALIETAKWYLQLDDLQEKQILEYRLAEPENKLDGGMAGFVENVAASTPTPGGGSVAALAGTLAAALTQMVAGLTVGRKKYAAVDEQAQDILVAAGRLRAQLNEAIAADSAAFEALMAVNRNKTLNEEKRNHLMEEATIRAGEIPLQVARLSCQVAGLAQTIVAIGNVNAVTDGAAGAIMARAAVQTASLNVQINGLGLKNQQLAAQWKAEVQQLENAVNELAQKTLAEAAHRGGF